MEPHMPATAVAVERLTLSSACHVCGCELRPPAKRNTVYMERSTGGAWFARGRLPVGHVSAGVWPFCVSCARKR